MSAIPRLAFLFLGAGLAVAGPGDAMAFGDITVTAEPGGIAAGGDIKNNTINQTINKLDLTNLPEFIKAFSDRENANKDLLDEAKRGPRSRSP